MTKNKEIKKAVALKYDRLSGQAPRVKASGRGKIADKIIEKAKEHNIPVTEDPDLVEILSKIKIEEEIPPELYKAVAELLSYIYSKNKK